MRLYAMATRECRVGTMMGAPLLHMLTPESAKAVLEVFDSEFTSDLHRQQTFEKLMIIDQCATTVRQNREEEQRKIADAQK